MYSPSKHVALFAAALALSLSLPLVAFGLDATNQASPDSLMAIGTTPQSSDDEYYDYYDDDDEYYDYYDDDDEYYDSGYYNDANYDIANAEMAISDKSTSAYDLRIQVTSPNGISLEEDEDFEIVYLDDYPEPGGTVVGKIVGIGDYYGSQSFSHDIICDLAGGNSHGTVIYDQVVKMRNYDDFFGTCYKYSVASRKYTGKPKAPKVKVAIMYEGDYPIESERAYDIGKEPESELYELEEGKDYTITYRNNIDAGTATIVVKGKNHYKGTIKRTFKIYCPISKVKVSAIKNQTYTGKALKPEPRVTYRGKTLKLGKDYKLSYRNNKNAGEATVIIKSTVKEGGSTSRTFNICASLERARIFAIPAQYLFTSAAKPVPDVKVGSKWLKYGRDFTLQYENNKSAGKATLTIKGKGFYRGEKTVHFKIIEPGEGKTISYAEFSKIKNGMTYKKVKYLIGGAGRLTGEYGSYPYYYKSYQWDGDNDYSSVTIRFKNGHVCDKYQYGL